MPLSNKKLLKKKRNYLVKQTKNVIKTYDFINNVKKKKSLMINHKKKSLINPKAKYKNTLLIDIFKKEEEESIKKLKYLNHPNRIYEFDIKFLEILKQNENKETNILDVLSKIQNICEDIKHYKSKKKDIQYYCKKLGDTLLNYAKNAIPEMIEMKFKIGEESKVLFIYKKCIDKKINTKLRILCFQILNFIIKKTRFFILKKNIFRYLSEDNKLITNLIDKYYNNIIEELGYKHLKYLENLIY